MRIEAVRAVVPSLGVAERGPAVEVWIPGATDRDLDVVARSGTGPASSDSIVEQAYRTGVKVLEYAEREFGRRGHDDQGAKLKLRVHAPDPLTGSKQANNAFWFNDEQRIWLGDGDGDQFAPLGGADDVVAHEFFHGVVDAEIKLEYTGQEGALHESFADTLSTGIDGNWQIGEDVFTPTVAGDALRDLSKLHYTRLVDLPDWEDEVHAMSEVPSQAAYLVGTKLGQAEMRRVWYTALTEKLRDHSGFAGARDATIAAAIALYGAGTTKSQAVIDAWAAVGVDATTPKR